MEVILRKGYARKLSSKYQSEEFVTSVEKKVVFNTKEEYILESEKLAAQVKALTAKDIAKHSDVLKTVGPGDPALMEERTF